MIASDVQGQLELRREGSLAHGAVPARVAVHDAHVLRQVAAAREGLVAPHAVGDGDRVAGRASADLRQVLRRLAAVHLRHVLTEEDCGVEHQGALRAGEPVVRLPQVQGQRHAAAEELGTLVAVELDAAVHQVAVLVEVRPVDERFPTVVTRQLLLRRAPAVVSGLGVGRVEHRVADRTAEVGVGGSLVAHQRVDPLEHGRAHVAPELRRLVVHTDVATEITFRRKRFAAHVARLRTGR